MAEIKRDTFWQDFFYTELTTGLRPGEPRGLMRPNFDEIAGTLAVRCTIHKANDGRLAAADIEVIISDPHLLNIKAKKNSLFLKE